MMLFLYDAMAHYRNGFLLVDGGVLDQPVKLMQALAIVGDEQVKCDDERKAEADRKDRMRRMAAASGGDGRV